MLCDAHALINLLNNIIMSRLLVVCTLVLSVIVRVNLLPVNDDLHGDYVNDKNFKRGFQQWLNALWSKKDQQIDAIKREYNNAGQ